MNKKRTFPSTKSHADYKPWHEEILPSPVSQKLQDREYVFVSGKGAARELWAALFNLLENEDGSPRLSRLSIAKCMGVSDKLIHRWLSGPSNMSIETAGKLSASMRADLHIIAVPWEDNDVQLRVHSYSCARLGYSSTKHIISNVIMGRATPIPDHTMNVKIFLTDGFEDGRLGNVGTTARPKGLSKVEVEHHD